MKTPRGFVSLGVVIAVIIGALLLGGVAYYAMHAGARSPATATNSTTTPSASPEASTPAGTSGTIQAQAAVSNDSVNRNVPVTGSEQSLMKEIGCTDQQSCVSACMKFGMTSACAQLQSAMSASEQAYTAGTQSGPTRASDVAFVGNNTTASASALPSCPADNAVFDTAPVVASDLSGIEPLGHMNGEHILPNQADHLYLIANASEASVPVYAPGNATLLAVAKFVGSSGADKGQDSVVLYFSPCKSTMFAFQFSSLSPQIENALANQKPTAVTPGATITSTIYGNLAIPLSSGEELGTMQNVSGLGAQTDFAATDVRTTPLAFIDQGESTGFLADSYAHTVCPLDYFTPRVKTTLDSALMTQNAGANGIPACGAVMQDKAGTAQGNWYDKSGSAPSYQGIDEASLLAIVHYNLNPAKGIISVGTDLIPSSYLGTQLIFTTESSGFVNREPSQIVPDGNVYCFDGAMGAGGNGPLGHVDIRLDSATKLEADYGSGACAASPALSRSVVTYER